MRLVAHADRVGEDKTKLWMLSRAQAVVASPRRRAHLPNLALIVTQ
jgi:hypothetical protein